MKNLSAWVDSALLEKVLSRSGVFDPPKGCDGPGDRLRRELAEPDLTQRFTAREAGVPLIFQLLATNWRVRCIDAGSENAVSGSRSEARLKIPRGFPNLPLVVRIARKPDSVVNRVVISVSLVDLPLKFRGWQ